MDIEFQQRINNVHTDTLISNEIHNFHNNIKDTCVKVSKLYDKNQHPKQMVGISVYELNSAFRHINNKNLFTSVILH